MKKMSLGEMKSLSRNEMKKIMAGSGSGQCTTAYGCMVGLSCWVYCEGNATAGTCAPYSKYGNCNCAGGC